MPSFWRGLIASAITVIAGVGFFANVPIALVLAALVAMWMAFRARLGVLEIVAFAPMTLMVAAFSLPGIAWEHINPIDPVEAVFYFVLWGVGVVASFVLVLVASLVAMPNIRGTSPSRVLAPLALVIAGVLLVLASVTASRHPTMRGWVARAPVVARFPAMPPEDRSRGWSDMVLVREADCGDTHVRFIRFGQEGNCTVTAEKSEHVLPEVRGEPGDFGRVIDFCQPATVRCADGLAIVEYPHDVVTFPNHNRHERLPPEIEERCAPSRAWLVGASLGLAIALASVIAGRKSPAWTAFGAVVALLGAAPLIVQALVGRIWLG